MKLVQVAATAITLLVLLFSNACASHRQLDGLLIGGGTGAILGQAIGHDAESTIVGATVGGVVGLMIGSELDSHHRVVYHHPVHRRPVITHVIRQHNYRDRHRTYSKPRYDRRPVYKDHRSDKHYRSVHRKITTIRHGRDGSTRIVKTRYSKGHGKHPRRDHKFAKNRHKVRY